MSLEDGPSLPHGRNASAAVTIFIVRVRRFMRKTPKEGKREREGEREFHNRTGDKCQTPERGRWPRPSTCSTCTRSTPGWRREDTPAGHQSYAAFCPAMVSYQSTVINRIQHKIYIYMRGASGLSFLLGN